MLTSRSIPSHSSHDIVAILSNTMGAKFSPLVSEILSKRLMGIHPTNIFQIINTVYRHRSRAIVPVSLLNQLLSGLVDEFGEDSLDSAAIVRGIEMIAEMVGQGFDPLELMHSPTVLRIISDPTTPVPLLVRLYSIGGVTGSFNLRSRISGTVSDYDLARIAYLTGDTNALDQIKAPTSPDTFPYILQAIAAWDLDTKYIPTISPEVVARLSPHQAQVSLWSGLAAGLKLSQLDFLESVANRELWKSHSMHEEYKMSTISDYVPRYPARIPQMGAERKHRISKHIRNILEESMGMKVTRTSSASHAFDICARDLFYMDVVTYPDDPKYKIHKKFINSTLPVIEILANSPPNLASIQEIVRPYL